MPPRPSGSTSRQPPSSLPLPATRRVLDAGVRAVGRGGTRGAGQHRVSSRVGGQQVTTSRRTAGPRRASAARAAGARFARRARSISSSARLVRCQRSPRRLTAGHSPLAAAARPRARGQEGARLAPVALERRHRAPRDVGDLFDGEAGEHPQLDEAAELRVQPLELARARLDDEQLGQGDLDGSRRSSIARARSPGGRRWAPRRRTSSRRIWRMARAASEKKWPPVARRHLASAGELDEGLVDEAVVDSVCRPRRPSWRCASRRSSS